MTVVKKKVPKAFTSSLVRKKEWGMAIKKNKSRKKRRKNKSERGNKILYGKNSNGLLMLLTVNYKALTIVSNSY